jgi:hypothetical protein
MCCNPLILNVLRIMQADGNIGSRFNLVVEPAPGPSLPDDAEVMAGLPCSASPIVFRLVSSDVCWLRIGPTMES